MQNCSSDRHRRPFLIAHRANTLPDIKRAIEQGLDFVEIDFRQSADGEIVAAHDNHLRWQTNGRGTVSEKTLEAIKRLEVKTKLTHTAPVRVPTLEECLEAITGQIGLVAEIKVGITDSSSFSYLAMERLLRLGRAMLDRGKFIVASRRQRVLKMAKQVDPDVCTGKHGIFEPVFLSMGIRRSYEILLLSEHFASKHLVHRAHRMGLRVFISSVRGVSDISVADAVEADGIYVALH